MTPWPLDRARRWSGRLVLAARLVGLPGGGARADWLVVDYSELVDRRVLSHSGESVGALLQSLTPVVV